MSREARVIGKLGINISIVILKRMTEKVPGHNSYAKELWID